MCKLNSNFIVKVYSIHLMWINSFLDPGQTYLNKAQTSEELFKSLLLPAIKWKKANPEAGVYIWYDSAYTTQNAIDRTKQVLSEFSLKNNVSGVNLKDIREIPIINVNPDIFSNQLPIYFKVDLLKGIIIVDSIEREKVDAAIFTDLEVGDLREDGLRMNKGELFEPSIMDRLREIGLILGSGSFDCENQFLQLVNHPRMLNTMKHSFINLCLMRALTALNAPDTVSEMSISLARYNEEAKKTSARLQLFPQLSVMGYHVIKRLVRQAFCCSRLSVCVNDKNHPDPKGHWVQYDVNTHGYEPLGLYTLSSGAEFAIGLDDKVSFLWEGEVLKKTFFEYKKSIGRDMRKEVRFGRGHLFHVSELIFQEPANDNPLYKCELMQLASSDPYSYYLPTTASYNDEEVIERCEINVDSDFKEKHQTSEESSLPEEEGQSEVRPRSW